MKIFEYSNGEMKTHKSLVEALKIDVNKKSIISFVGGGGKTSSIYKLGQELKECGKKVIITTTTHMFLPENDVVLTGKNEDITKLLYEKGMITVGMLCDEKDEKSQKSKSQDDEKVHNNCEKTNLQKISGLPKEIAENLIKIADFILVEADGAKTLPLKVPAQHEPVILAGSNLVVGVCGVDAIGKSVNKTCHRSNLVAKFLATGEEHIINAYDVAKILSSTNGMRKNVICTYKAIINKADTIEELAKATDVCRELHNFGMNEVIITTFKDES